MKMNSAEMLTVLAYLLTMRIVIKQVSADMIRLFAMTLLLSVEHYLTSVRMVKFLTKWLVEIIRVLFYLDHIITASLYYEVRNS